MNHQPFWTGIHTFFGNLYMFWFNNFFTMVGGKMDGSRGSIRRFRIDKLLFLWRNHSVMGLISQLDVCSAPWCQPAKDDMKRAGWVTKKCVSKSKWRTLHLLVHLLTSMLIHTGVWNLITWDWNGDASWRLWRVGQLQLPFLPHLESLQIRMPAALQASTSVRFYAECCQLGP